MPEVSQTETRAFGVERLLRSLDRVDVQIKRVLTRHDAETVHDLRVAARRFLQVLAAFKTAIPSGKKRIRRQMKKMLSLAGAVRDCDIALLFLSRKTSPYAAGLRKSVRAERQTAEQPLLEYLNRWVSNQISRRWHRQLQNAAATEHPARAAVSETARVQLPRLAELFFRFGDHAARPKSSAAELHRFRLAAKTYRYTLEIFAALYAPPASEWLRRLKALQQVLGAISDCESGRALFARLGNHPKLQEYLKLRARRKAADFRRMWAAEFSDLSEHRQWPQLLAAPERAIRKPAGRSLRPGTAAAAAYA